MNEQLINQVKNSLNKQFYSTNHSWLVDCVEFYLEDNNSPTQEDIITFVKNQWQLCDLKEINNENGSLPNNLKNIKCTTLQGKYILQMQQIYDISTSKFKQLEKIRNVSSENVDATEKENINQEDKFKPWEPKSKRMLQLHLTDGIQDILAIEYKPIRSLKDSLFPGYKLLIKGPVICRRGVILLEEKNVAEVGGEVDAILITNAPENIFARYLNLEENPDPYNDNVKKVKNENSFQTDLMEDDFDLDSQSIAQIDQQIQQQNSSTFPQRTAASCTKDLNTKQNSSTIPQKTAASCTKDLNTKQNLCLADEDDAFLNMIDEKDILHASTKNLDKLKIVNQPSTSSTIQKDDFPTEDEYDEIVNCQSSVFKYPLSKPRKGSDTLQNNKNNKNSLLKSRSPKKSSVGSSMSHIEMNQCNENDFSMPLDSYFSDSFSHNDESEKYNINKVSSISCPSTSKKNNSYDSLTRHNVVSFKKNYSHQSSIITSNQNKNLNDNKDKNLNDNREYKVQIKKELNENFEKKMEIDNGLLKLKHISGQLKTVDTGINRSERSSDSTSCDNTGIKRLASIRSPSTDSPHKKSCWQSPPKLKKNDDFSEEPVMNEDTTIMLDFISSLKEQCPPEKGVKSSVRGKVTNVVKLNLLKNDKGPYFHLEGTITDGTGNMEVVFSSMVLEKIIGYTPMEFTQKRRQAKTNPEIKEELRNDLTKAQQILRDLDVMMVIKFKKNEKPLILETAKLTDSHKRIFDERIKKMTKDRSM